MKAVAYKILVTLFTLLPSLNAGELIEVSAVSDTAGPDFREMPYTYGDNKVTLNVYKVPIIVTEDVASISTGNDPLIVHAELSAEGLKKMKKGTADMKRKQIAIIVDGRVQLAPILLEAPLGGRFVTEFRDKDEAKAFLDKFKKTGKPVKNSSEIGKPDKASLVGSTTVERIKADGVVDGMIDGTKWTLAALSDSLDQDFTMDDARRLFGNTPSIEKDKKDEKFTVMTYWIATPDLYKHGVRMTKFEMLFEGNVLNDATIGFSRYYGNEPKNSSKGKE